MRQNIGEGTRWLRNPAEKGIPEAQFALGIALLGTEDEENTDAAKWVRKAADQGLPLAQYHLGLLYEAGHGVDRSLHLALEWIRKAADQGMEEANVRLREIWGRDFD